MQALKLKTLEVSLDKSEFINILENVCNFSLYILFSLLSKKYYPNLNLYKLLVSWLDWFKYKLDKN